MPKEEKARTSVKQKKPARHLKYGSRTRVMKNLRHNKLVFRKILAGTKRIRNQKN